MAADLLNELRVLVDRHGGHGGRPSALPRVILFRSTVSTNLDPIVYRPVLCVVLQGSRRIVLGQTIFNYSAGAYLLASVDLPVNAAVLEGDSEHPFLSFGLLLDLSMLAALVLEMPEPAQRFDPAPSLAMSVQDIPEDMLQAVGRLLRLLDRPEDIPILAPLAEREILYCLLRGPQGPMLRRLVQEGSRLERVSRAIQWIRLNYAKPFCIKAIAQLANMSVASLHRNFKAVTNMSPLQYQKEIRLAEARRLLMEHLQDAATVGFTVGYSSPTQFNREYRRQFGAPPGRDAARLRRSNAEAHASFGDNRL